MISYVECLSGEASGVTSRCCSPAPENDETDELLPRKIPVLQPKTEGSLRRRLLSARIHQRQQYAALQSQSYDLSANQSGPCFNPDASGRQLFPNHEIYVKPVFVPNRRTSCCPPTPEPRPGYVRTRPFVNVTTPSLVKPEVGLYQAVPPQFKYRPNKKRGFFRRRKRNKEATPLLQKG